ncbi:hypothetical protein FJZ31_07875 [Candidatus Poribacteria bacterium]|nr:hypothetical protein [Candidatus Poribacteria bacterium]
MYAEFISDRHFHICVPCARPDNNESHYLRGLGQRTRHKLRLWILKSSNRKHCRHLIFPRILGVVIVVWLTVVIYYHIAFAANPNLCRNSSFEEELAAWTFETSYSKSATYHVQTGDARYGAKFVRVVNNGDGDANLSSTLIPVKDGLRYTISAYVRTFSPKAVRIGFWCFDQDMKEIVSDFAADAPILVAAQPYWAHVYRSKDLPDGCAYVRARLIMSGRGTVDWDGIKVEQYRQAHPIFAEFSVYTDGLQADGSPLAVQSRNLTVNSGFESGQTGWNIWLEKDKGPAAINFPEEGVNGSRCIQLSGKGKIVCSSEPIPCKPMTTYTLGVDAKVQGTLALITIQPLKEGVVHAIGNEDIWGYITVPLQQSEYKRFTKTVTTPGECRYLTVILRIEDSIGWFDSVQLEEGNVATEYVAGPLPVEVLNSPELQEYRAKAILYSQALVREGRVRDLMYQAERLLRYHQQNGGIISDATRFYESGRQELVIVKELLGTPYLVPDFANINFSSLNAKLSEAGQAFQKIFSALGYAEPSLDVERPELSSNMGRDDLAKEFLIIPCPFRQYFYNGRADVEVLRPFGFRIWNPAYQPGVTPNGEIAGDKYDHYFDLFAGVNMKTIGNISWHVVPIEKMEQEFGDAIYQRDADGKIGNRTILNIWHDGAMKYVRKTFYKFAEYYKNHPNVVGYEIMNEPWLNGGYSASAKAAFRTWLRETYRNDIESLNSAWGTQLNAFDQIEPPMNLDEPIIVVSNQRVDVGALFDFRYWRCLSFAQHFAMLIDTLHEAAPELPVCSEFSQGASWLRNDWAIDLLLLSSLPKWDIVGTHDWFHSSTPGALWNAGWLTASIARYTDTPLWESEYTILGFESETLLPEQEMRAAANRNVWRYAAWGKRALEAFAIDANEGIGTGRGMQSAFINAEADHYIPYYRVGGLPTIEWKINRIKSLLFPTQIVNQGLALLRPSSASLIYRSSWNYGVDQETIRFVKPLWEKHWQTIVVPEECIIDGREDLGKLRLIIAPQSTFVPNTLQEKLIDWVNSGGTLLCSTPFGLFDPWGRPTGILLERAFGQHVYCWDKKQGWNCPNLKGEEPYVSRIGKGRVIMSLSPFIALPDGSTQFDALLKEIFGHSLVFTDVPNVELLMREDREGNRFVWAVNLSREKSARGDLRLPGKYVQVRELTCDAEPIVPIRYDLASTVVPIKIAPGEGLCFAIGKVKSGN